MEAQTIRKTGMEKWQDGVDAAVQDPRWASHDCEIQTAVNEFNRHLSGIAGYVPLDWQIIKAMLWVESGPHKTEWNSKPMQIGVVGDPGLHSLLYGQEGGDLILSPAWRSKLTVGSVRTIPAHNIRAGIGYLLMRMASFEHRSVLAADARILEVQVRPGDSLDKIAKAQGSTAEVLTRLNPTAVVLRPGQVLRVQKATMRRVITRWMLISPALIAERYNGGGESNYARKLDYAIKLVRKGKAPVCAP